MDEINAQNVAGQHPHPALEKMPNLDLPNDDLIDLMKDVLERGAGFVFCAKGQSMLPFVRDGDRITIRPAFQQKPGLGKIVAYVHPVSGKLIVHRVVAVRGSFYYIRGDNNPTPGWDRASAKDILGCVSQVVRDDRQQRLGLGPERYLIAFLSSRGWLNGLLARLALLLRRFRG
ncbi:MAG: S24/S26 family peptidase [Brevefilum sp.]|nr:S24/S26 family peptidase [Brevefilum sp.]